MESLAKISTQVKEVRIYDKKTIEQEKINDGSKINKSLEKSPSYGKKVQSNMAVKSSVDVRPSKFLKQDKPIATQINLKVSLDS